MTLRQTLRASVAAVCVASLAAPAEAVAALARSRGGLEVRVAQAADFSRLEFHGAGAVSARREGETLILRFPRDADPDIARLHTDPPRWIRTAEKRHVGGRLELVVTLADDADFKVGSADGDAFVNVFAKPPPDPAAAQASQAQAQA